MGAKTTFISIVGVFVIGFLVFYHIHERHVHREARRLLEHHALVVANSLWQFEKEGPIAYLKLAAQSNHYDRIMVADEAGREFVSIRGPLRGKINRLLDATGLTHLHQMKRDVVYNNAVIGQITVDWHDTTFFTYLYIVFCILLILPGVWFFLRLTTAKKTLEARVIERTAALEESRERLRRNKERLDLALWGANDGIWDWDLATDVIHFDARYYVMAGYEPDEFPGAFEEWEKRTHPDDVGPAKAIVKRYLTGELDDFEIEFRFLHKDGRYMWFRGRGKITARDENGAPTRFVGTHSDIDQRKRAEEESRRLRNYLSDIIDSMPSTLVGVDAEIKVTQWNKTAERTTGVSADAARGKLLSDVFPRMASEMDNIAESIRTRKIKQKQKRAAASESGARDEEVTIYPLVAAGEKAAVIRVDDITDKVRMEEMMIQSEKMLSVGGLAAGMAHEINNPLAGMMQTAGVLANRLSGEADIPANRRAAEAAGASMASIQAFMEARDVPRMLGVIKESGRRVADIVDNMLSFARKSDDRTSSHALADLIDRTLELASTDYDLKKQYDFKKIEIRREYENGLPPPPCEGAKIQQVLLNILRNGAQAMQDAAIQGPAFIVRTRFEKERGMVCMEIEDNGPGMDEATRKRVFEPFYTTKPVG
ncbi:MAG: PAS domain S-box protein, partial [Desulfobacterales bacterium]|nr:PAS domain S-box protein [Desulfobacterales bacterium]